MLIWVSVAFLSPQTSLAFPLWPFSVYRAAAHCRFFVFHAIPCKTRLCVKIPGDQRFQKYSNRPVQHKHALCCWTKRDTGDPIQYVTRECTSTVLLSYGAQGRFIIMQAPLNNLWWENYWEKRFCSVSCNNLCCSVSRRHHLKTKGFLAAIIIPYSSFLFFKKGLIIF